MSQFTAEAGRTPAAVRARIKPERRRRAVGPGLAQLLGTGGAWLACTVAVAVVPWWWLRVPLGVLDGLLVSMLFVVGHDAAHGSLFPRRWMNKLAGRLGLLPALHPLASWVHTHNRLHHAFTNVREKDPGLPPLSPSEYRGLGGWRRWLERRYRTWYGLGLYYLMDMWLKWEVFPTAARAPKTRAFRVDRLLVLAFALAWVGGLCWAGGWEPWACGERVLAGFVLPQLVWHWLIGFIIFQQHTHPAVPWYSEVDSPAPSYYASQVLASPHLMFPPAVRWVMRNIMEHTAHHADPLVPLYELPAAQRELIRGCRGDVLREVWSVPLFLRTLRTCRLYDYAAHRWLDYDGTPTTTPLLPDATVEVRGETADAEALAAVAG